MAQLYNYRRQTEYPYTVYPRARIPTHYLSLNKNSSIRHCLQKTKSIPSHDLSLSKNSKSYNMYMYLYYLLLPIEDKRCTVTLFVPEQRYSNTCSYRRQTAYTIYPQAKTANTYTADSMDISHLVQVNLF